jgi:hypothetical protein
VLSRLEKCKQIVDIRHNFRVTHSSVNTICDNTDRTEETAKTGTKETAKSGTKVFVCVARLPQSYHNEPYQKLWMSVPYIFIALEINKYIV